MTKQKRIEELEYQLEMANKEIQEFKDRDDELINQMELIVKNYRSKPHDQAQLIGIV
jgi:hypothetical protein